jgi:hypothetical protein
MHRTIMAVAWWHIVTMAWLPLTYGQEIVVYLKSGEEQRGALLLLDDRVLQFDPIGEVSFRAIPLGEVATIVMVDKDGLLAGTLYPNPGANVVQGRGQKVYRFLREKAMRGSAFSTISFEAGLQTPITLLKLNQADSSGTIFPFTLHMERGSGVGLGASLFFPISSSGAAMGVRIETASISTSWTLSTVSERITLRQTFAKGRVFSLDGSLTALFPVHDRRYTFLVAPAVGIGVRRMSGKSDDSSSFEEKNLALFVSLRIEYPLTRQLTVFLMPKVWNSDLKDFYFYDTPRFTALEIRSGISYYL